MVNRDREPELDEYVKRLIAAAEPRPDDGKTVFGCAAWRMWCVRMNAPRQQ